MNRREFLVGSVAVGAAASLPAYSAQALEVFKPAADAWVLKLYGPAGEVVAWSELSEPLVASHEGGVDVMFDEATFYASGKPMTVVRVALEAPQDYGFPGEVTVHHPRRSLWLADGDSITIQDIGLSVR